MPRDVELQVIVGFGWTAKNGCELNPQGIASRVLRNEVTKSFCISGNADARREASHLAPRQNNQTRKARSSEPNGYN